LSALTPPRDLRRVFINAERIPAVLKNRAERARVHNPVTYRERAFALTETIDRNKRRIEVPRVRWLMQANKEPHSRRPPSPLALARRVDNPMLQAL
jgi:hypothetical protein